MNSHLARLARRAALASSAALGLAFAAPAVAVPFTVDLGPQSSDNAGADFVWTFDAPTGFSSAVVTLTLDGDFNTVREHADISLDGFSLGRVLDGSNGDDGRGEFDLFDFARDDDADTGSGAGAPVSGAATLTPTDIGALLLDGTATFMVNTSTAVDNSTTTASARIEFIDATFDSGAAVDVPTPVTAALLGLGLLAAGASRQTTAAWMNLRA